MTEQQLKERDYIVLVDASGSMGRGAGGKRTGTRWEAAAEVTEGIARSCEKYDSNGITVGVFSSTCNLYENIKAGGDAVRRIFEENSPNNGTATHVALGKVFDTYFAAKKAGAAKPITVLVFTDGEPDDENALAQCIINATKQMDNDNEIGVSFVQIGDDAKAREFLKRLDDRLQPEGAKFDIVDTRNLDEVAEMSIEALLSAAVED